jgi:hypothetical protein
MTDDAAPSPTEETLRAIVRALNPRDLDAVMA